MTNKRMIRIDRMHFEIMLNELSLSGEFEDLELAPPKHWKPFCYDCYDDDGNQHEGCVEADRKSLEEQAGPCQFCIYRERGEKA